MRRLRPKVYIVANSTNIFSGHAVYGTDVTGQLKLGEKVEVLAKVKGWDWMLVGKEGHRHRLRAKFDARS